MASITCGNCKATHSSVSEVRSCYAATSDFNSGKSNIVGQQHALTNPIPPAPATTISGSNGATPKQIAFLTKLCQERPTWAAAVGYCPVVINGMSKRVISQAIGDALGVPKEATLTDQATAQPGGYDAKKGDVHYVDGIYYRIHIGQKSGFAYACRAYIIGEAQWGEDGKLVEPADIRWDRVAGMIKKLGEATKATPDQAAAFGKLVGRCCFCSHAIDTPESTAVGYGPICAGKYGLPWGEAITTTA